MKPPVSDVDEVKIYVLPNLMTAGNLVCGFLAVLKIIEGTLQRQQGIETWRSTYETSLYFILAACIFDLLDGRLARLGGKESPFGQEFDSLADIVSFGVAPALLVFKIVLAEFESKLAWMVAVTYLVCGALRLARFNVLATLKPGAQSKEFTGFPIPAAAGLISSITLLMLRAYDSETAFREGYGKYALAVLMLFLSFMMFSKFKYPSFKSVNWRTKYSLRHFVFFVLLACMVLFYYEYMLAVCFVSYLLYGFLRPFLSRAWRRAVEEPSEEDDSNGTMALAGPGMDGTTMSLPVTVGTGMETTTVSTMVPEPEPESDVKGEGDGDPDEMKAEKTADSTEVSSLTENKPAVSEPAATALTSPATEDAGTKEAQSVTSGQLEAPKSGV
ncbi:MAG TPA: CDP-diacylglycerol--serine O-phosphatidyltransferase [Candidatus Methylacidiphilales bacterium]|nr:CDP-diacylglycerol--serine O-phosphatidyltransferase [Candidatus Methylacidiphilales bacterium]